MEKFNHSQTKKESDGDTGWNFFKPLMLDSCLVWNWKPFLKCDKNDIFGRIFSKAGTGIVCFVQY